MLAERKIVIRAAQIENGLGKTSKDADGSVIVEAVARSKKPSSNDIIAETVIIE